MKENPSFVLNGYILSQSKILCALTGQKKIKYISELHKYMYLFYKTGSIGILILLFFLHVIYRMLYLKDKYRNFVTVFISSIGLLIFVYHINNYGIYNGRDVIFLF
jgi:cell division protein FtsW (lipid II flippase)